jgi:hypothetical protein
VGEEKKIWYIHEALLCARSDYFSQALQEGFKENQQKELYLEEIDADAFSLFVDWLYGNGGMLQHTKRSDEDRRSRTV